MNKELIGCNALIVAFYMAYQEHKNNCAEELIASYPTIEQAYRTLTDPEKLEAIALVRNLVGTGYSFTTEGLSAALLHANNLIRGII